MFDQGLREHNENTCTKTLPYQLENKKRKLLKTIKSTLKEDYLIHEPKILLACPG